MKQVLIWTCLIVFGIAIPIVLAHLTLNANFFLLYLVEVIALIVYIVRKFFVDSDPEPAQKKRTWY